MESEILKLDFKGPFSFLPEKQWLFDDKNMKKSGVYIWTITPTSFDKRYILYVGQSYDILLRHATHMKGILCLDYSIYKPSSDKPFWKRDFSIEEYKGNYQIYRKQLQQYESPEMNKNVIDYLRMIEIFFVELKGSQRDDRERIEGMIGHCFQEKYGENTEEGKFYPKGVHLPNKNKKYGRPLIITFPPEIRIVGLNSETKIPNQ